MASEADPCPAWLRAALSEVRCLEEMKPNLDSLANYIALGLGYLERANLDDVLRERMLDAFTKYGFGDGHLKQLETILSPADGTSAFKFKSAEPASAPPPPPSNRGHGKKPERLSIWKVGLDVQKMM